MGNPIKSAGVIPFFSHQEVVFTNLQDATEALAVITEVPMNRSVIVGAHFFQSLSEDGTGTADPRGLALRQVTDTSVGLWCTEEANGSVGQLTFHVQFMTFPDSAILNLVHYVQNYTLQAGNNDWLELDMNLSQSVSDPTKACVFSGIWGSSFWPRPVEPGGDNMNNAEFFIDTADGNKVKLRYQSENTPDFDHRMVYSVLELK